LDNALKSWAVTRGPNLVPGEKRLSVEVEDHPLDYAGFEGTIPKGQYGGGTVIVWDRGTWTPEGDPHKGLVKGHLDFHLDGEKLKGLWHLVRMRRKPRDKRNNWLLIKSDDEAARGPGDPDILDEQPQSVATGRTIEEVAGGVKTLAAARQKRAIAGKADGKATVSQTKPVTAAALKGARKALLPAFVQPCLATLVPKPPAGSRWLHEIKFDGYRIQVRVESGKVWLKTRTGLDWTRKFGTEIVAAFARLPVSSAMFDGELVVENAAGASDFGALQSALEDDRTDRFIYYAFDLLYADGYDLRKVGLAERKKTLATILSKQAAGSPLRYSEHFAETGEALLANACRLGLEGIVSKVSSSYYRSGRGHDWLKAKCSKAQEFVIVGYVPSSVSKRAIGSLVLGYHEAGKLVYAGRVGTGFSAVMAHELWQRLEPLGIAKQPFEQELSSDERRHVRWVRPTLAAEVEVRAWTPAGNLRHASFRGLREDKPTSEIVRESPKAKPMSTSKRASFGIKLTHPDRIYWPDVGVTKQGLADYYAGVWPWIAPHIIARPLSLLRCPGGTEEQCFFQKQSWKGLPANIAVLANPGSGGKELLVIQDLDGLIALVQSGVLELHPWGSTVGDLDHPDRLIFDLDPGPGVAWDKVAAAAIAVRDRLRDRGLQSFLKTSGGKGLHVVVPLAPAGDWDTAKAFSRAIAEAMAKQDPRLYTATVAKQARQGRIFIDYLRNGRGATAVAPFSTRARAGAPVSTPISWNELSSKMRGDRFNIADVPERLAHLSSDPWAGFFKTKQRLPTN
jgi:bifunctional non-homologous end joining protein LigD